MAQGRGKSEDPQPLNRRLPHPAWRPPAGVDAGDSLLPQLSFEDGEDIAEALFYFAFGESDLLESRNVGKLLGAVL